MKKQLGLEQALSGAIEAETAGDPCSQSKWVRQSLRQLQAKLASVGVLFSHVSMGRLLKQQSYSLQANRKSVATTQHPQRDIQFRYIWRVQQRFRQAGHPLISVDAKKKELIGNFKNAGRSWCKRAEQVNDHEFHQDALAKAVSYGIYSVSK